MEAVLLQAHFGFCDKSVISKCESKMATKFQINPPIVYAYMVTRLQMTVKFKMAAKSKITVNVTSRIGVDKCNQVG